MISKNQKLQITHKLSKKTGVNDWTISGPEVEARECIIYKATSQLYSHHIAIKIYRKIQKGNSLVQYDALKSISLYLNQKDNEFFVPEVFGSFPDQGIFMMQWVESPTLERRLWRYFYSKKHVQSDISRTFKWLKAFHHYAKPKSKKTDIDYYKNAIDKGISDHQSKALHTANKTFLKGKNVYLDSLNNTDVFLHCTLIPMVILLHQIY